MKYFVVGMLELTFENGFTTFHQTSANCKRDDLQACLKSLLIIETFTQDYHIMKIAGDGNKLVKSRLVSFRVLAG